MTTTSQRRSLDKGGGTSPTPLRRSQNAWGEVRSKSLLLPVGESLQSLQSLAVSDARFGDGISQPLDGLIVDYSVHWIRMAVLPAVCEAESCRIAHARWRSVDDVSDQRQRSHGFGSDSGNGQQLLVILRARLIGPHHHLAQVCGIYVLLDVDPVTRGQRHRDHPRNLLVDEPRFLSREFRRHGSRAG